MAQVLPQSVEAHGGQYLAAGGRLRPLKPFSLSDDTLEADDLNEQADQELDCRDMCGAMPGKLLFALMAVPLLSLFNATSNVSTRAGQDLSIERSWFAGIPHRCRSDRALVIVGNILF